jgi:uncharacterized protein (TIGR02271 family)
MWKRTNAPPIANASKRPNMRKLLKHDRSPLGSATGTAPLDDARRLQLREERLLIDKQRVGSGETRIRKEVAWEQQTIDVPVFHEELFIRRRPISEDAALATAPIGEDCEEIRIPLSEERVDVQKRTVVTEQNEILKRKVEDTEHVYATVRREELRVDDDGFHARMVNPKSGRPPRWSQGVCHLTRARRRVTHDPPPRFEARQSRARLSARSLVLSPEMGRISLAA